MTPARGDIQLAADFRDCISALNARNVDFILVGAYAVGWHGAVRATGDIDFLYQQSKENVQRLCAALRDFGAPASAVDANFMMSREPIVQIGVAPLRIDFIATLSGVTFAEVAESAIDDSLDGLPLRIIGLEILLRNKRSTGRSKDKSDVRQLEKLISSTVKVSEVERPKRKR